MIAGTLIGFIFVAKWDAMTMFSDSILAQIVDPGLSWVILFSILIGGMMGLIEAAKASSAFTRLAIRYANSEKKVFFLTLILAILIYPDEYLRGMTLNTAMANVYKRNRIPKEMFGYSICAVGIPIVTLIPATTWAVYFGGLLETSGLSDFGMGLVDYVKVIPFSFYSILFVIIFLLVACGVIPKFGGIKKAYAQIADGTYDFSTYAVPEEEGSRTSLMDFLLPLLVVIFTAIIFGNNMMVGIFFGILVAFALYILKGYTTVDEAMESFWEGAKAMIVPMAIVVVSYSLAEVMDLLGFADVVYRIKPFIIPQILPMLAFVFSCILCYYTGEFWGMAAILLPAMLPLATDFGINVWLLAGAVFSGSVFGSHTCVYGDYNALIGECIDDKQVNVAMNNTPYALLCAALAAVAYLLVGFIL